MYQKGQSEQFFMQFVHYSEQINSKTVNCSEHFQQNMMQSAKKQLSLQGIINYSVSD